MVPQRCKVPISIVAVNHIEVIGRIDWLHNELNIYGGGIWTTYFLMRWFFLRYNPIFDSLIWFTDVLKWTGGYFTPKMCNLKMLASS